MSLVIYNPQQLSTLLSTIALTPSVRNQLYTQARNAIRYLIEERTFAEQPGLPFQVPGRPTTRKRKMVVSQANAIQKGSSVKRLWLKRPRRRLYRK